MLTGSVAVSALFDLTDLSASKTRIKGRGLFACVHMCDTSMLLCSSGTGTSLSPGHMRPAEPGDLMASPASAAQAWAGLEVEAGCGAAVMTCDHRGAALHLPSFQGPVVQLQQLCSWRTETWGTCHTP